MADWNKLAFFKGVKKKIDKKKRSKKIREARKRGDANPFNKTGESTFAEELLERTKRKKNY